MVLTRWPISPLGWTVDSDAMLDRRGQRSHPADDARAALSYGRRGCPEWQHIRIQDPLHVLRPPALALDMSRWLRGSGAYESVGSPCGRDDANRAAVAFSAGAVGRVAIDGARVSAYRQRRRLTHPRGGSLLIVPQGAALASGVTCLAILLAFAFSATRRSYSVCRFSHDCASPPK
jgi:hypothetical protein